MRTIVGLVSNLIPSLSVDEIDEAFRPLRVKRGGTGRHQRQDRPAAAGVDASPCVSPYLSGDGQAGKLHAAEIDLRW